MDIPVTVQHGAVIEWVGLPADDGCWEPAGDAEVTHVPDNTPADPPDGGEQLDDDLDVDAEQQQIHLDDTAGE